MNHEATKTVGGARSVVPSALRVGGAARAESRVKPIIRWPGGKTRLLDRILPRIPKHTCYLHAKPKTYAGWNEAQMTELHDHLAKLQGRWLLTVDDSRFNRDLFRGCRMQSVTHRNGCVNHANLPSANFSELIISPR